GKASFTLWGVKICDALTRVPAGWSRSRLGKRRPRGWESALLVRKTAFTTERTEIFPKNCDLSEFDVAHSNTTCALTRSYQLCERQLSTEASNIRHIASSHQPST